MEIVTGNIKLLKGGRPAVYSSIHPSSSTICLGLNDSLCINCFSLSGLSEIQLVYFKELNLN